MKKVIASCGIILGIFLIIILICIAGLFRLLKGEEQKPPQITKGEFPFIVEYEMNGKTSTVEDTVVCEFDGYDLSALTDNKPRKWKEYLKSGDETKCIIIKEENQPSAIKVGKYNEWADLSIFYGFGEYYMGDPIANNLNYKYPQFVYYETYSENGENHYNRGTKLNEEELEKYFGIKVKRFEFSAPIKNTFR